MTREEAIKELSYIADEMPSMECAIWLEAISMAIEALQQEPCEDAVSREAAVDACLNGWNKDYKEIVTEIRALPPVTPAEKVGYWEWVKYENSSILGDWVCSDCKSVVVEGVRKYNEEARPTYKYCPQCGAKMEVAE